MSGPSIRNLCPIVLSPIVLSLGLTPARDHNPDRTGEVGMASEDIAAALERMQSALVRRPAAAVREDQFLTQWRMLLAANLLRHGNASLLSIAEDVGYQTGTAFSRPFRRDLGEPPTTWRRRQAVSGERDS